MPTYLVTRKTDSAEVYRYASTAPIEWVGFEFATHDHVEAAEPEGSATTPGVTVWTQLAFLRRMTSAERVAIRALAKTDPNAEDFMELLAAADEVRSDDQDVMAGLQYLPDVGTLAAGRMAEILGAAR